MKNEIDINQFVDGIDTLKLISSPDESVQKIAKLIDIYQSTTCRILEYRIRRMIDFLCERVDKKIDLCDSEITEIIGNLCEDFDLYRKTCCKGYPCCFPKLKDWPVILFSLNVIDQSLTPDMLTKSIVEDFPKIEIDESIIEFPRRICQILMEEIEQTITRICKYRKNDLCSDNELTRALIKLCQIYPYYKNKCCT